MHAQATSKVKIDGSRAPMKFAVNRTATMRFKSRFKVGERWRTRGGWLAKILYVTDNGLHSTVLHIRPKDATAPTWMAPTEDALRNHDSEGRVSVLLAVNDGPAWYGHPADLMVKVQYRKVKKLKVRK